jgi:hypothetical protein
MMIKIPETLLALLFISSCTQASHYPYGTDNASMSVSESDTSSSSEEFDDHPISDEKTAIATHAPAPEEPFAEHWAYIKALHRQQAWDRTAATRDMRHQEMPYTPPRQPATIDVGSVGRLNARQGHYAGSPVTPSDSDMRDDGLDYSDPTTPSSQGNASPAIGSPRNPLIESEKRDDGRYPVMGSSPLAPQADLTDFAQFVQNPGRRQAVPIDGRFIPHFENITPSVTDWQFEAQFRASIQRKSNRGEDLSMLESGFLASPPTSDYGRALKHWKLFWEKHCADAKYSPLSPQTGATRVTVADWQQTQCLACAGTGNYEQDSTQPKPCKSTGYRYKCHECEGTGILAMPMEGRYIPHFGNIDMGVTDPPTGVTDISKFETQFQASIQRKAKRGEDLSMLETGFLTSPPTSDFGRALAHWKLWHKAQCEIFMTTWLNPTGELGKLHESLLRLGPRIRRHK